MDRDPVYHRNAVPVPGTAPDVRPFGDRVGPVLCALFLGALHGRHGGLAGSDFVRRRPDLPGGRNLPPAWFWHLWDLGRADGFGFADSCQPDFWRILGP